ncbi:hypothetical protein PoB_005035300 [Plakobranchus ocellatus]|uniref:Uncharacterized protein n=1 Tax=Plakobranchus ocellatus TaxID=259542 RepID=A0AAV4BYG4_9GAST|nr:hypothetical protein PoB_005035300 [Plakobranchus ocellatus]
MQLSRVFLFGPTAAESFAGYDQVIVVYLKIDVNLLRRPLCTPHIEILDVSRALDLSQNTIIALTATGHAQPAVCDARVLSRKYESTCRKCVAD